MKYNECILELIKIRNYLLKEISGNEANIIMMQKYYQPYIDKIDELIKFLKQK